MRGKKKINQDDVQDRLARLTQPRQISLVRAALCLFGLIVGLWLTQGLLGVIAGALVSFGVLTNSIAGKKATLVGWRLQTRWSLGAALDLALAFGLIRVALEFGGFVSWIVLFAAVGLVVLSTFTVAPSEDDTPTP